MNQTRKCNSINECDRFTWPTAVQAVTHFAPVGNAETPVVVQHLDCSAFTVLQITSIVEAPFEVTDLVVNGEFQPALALAGQFRFLRFPVPMKHGSSFGAVLQTPPTTQVPFDCRYPKAPVSLIISTNRGDFAFNASEIIHPDGIPQWL